MRRYRSSGGDAMTFDDWMRARNPKYCPTDDTVALRELRDCWKAAEHHSDRAQERELMIQLMRNKCRKVGAGETAIADVPSIEAAHAMGANGGPAFEAERLVFEAWMRGHCWSLGATWNGSGYKSDSEHDGWPAPQAMRTRQMWAAWRDRAALTHNVQDNRASPASGEAPVDRRVGPLSGDET